MGFSGCGCLVISFDWAMKRLLRSKANFGIKVDQFDDIARDTLDEWVYFLKHEAIQEGFSAKGLKEAKDKLDVLKLPPAERAAYERWQDDLHLQASLVASNYGLGKIEGRKEWLEEGLKEGRDQERRQIARAMQANGVAPELIAQCTGLDPAALDEL
jgi:hypothetical protein